MVIFAAQRIAVLTILAAAGFSQAYNVLARRSVPSSRDVGPCRVATSPPEQGDSVGWTFIEQQGSTPAFQHWMLGQDYIDPANPGVNTDYEFTGLIFDAKLRFPGDNTLQIKKDPKRVTLRDDKFVVTLYSKDDETTRNFYLSHYDTCHFTFHNMKEWQNFASVGVYRYK